MFNLSEQVRRLQQLKHAKIHGLPYRPKQPTPKVQHIDGNVYETQAEQEEIFIDRGFHNHSIGFGRRLSKRKGQYHRPGGGFAGCTQKG